MNKLLVICGLVFLANTSTPEEKKETLACIVDEVEMNENQNLSEALAVLSTIGKEIEVKTVDFSAAARVAPCELDLDQVVYIEEEAEIDLGFDVTDYLPEGFDPNKSYVDLNGIEYLEEEEIELGFDANSYLPASFNAYDAPTGIEGIVYVEEQEPIDLGFNTSDYLPSNFDPYKTYEDLDAIIYLEDEEVIELGFDVNEYLPLGFDPHAEDTTTQNAYMY